MSLAGRSSFPLTLFTRAQEVIGLYHGGFYRRFGWAKPKDLPKDGLCYVVEWINEGVVRPLAYVDKIGRIFITSHTLSAPPARTPDMEFRQNPVYGMARGTLIANDPTGAVHVVGEFESRINRFKLTSKLLDELPLQQDEFGSLEQAATIVFVALLPENQNLVQSQAEEVMSTLSLEPHEVFERLSDAHTTQELLELLKNMVLQLQTRESLGKRNLRYPTYHERYLKRLLLESGVLETTLTEDELELEIRFMPIPRTGLYYILFNSPEITPELRSWSISVESVLNRYQLAYKQLNGKKEDEGALNLADQLVIESIAAQAPTFARHAEKETSNPYENWDVRYSFAQIIESLVLPYRLEADMRLAPNLQRALIQARCPEVNQMPRFHYVQSLDTWLPTTITERKVVHTRYVTRVAALVAACMFHAGKTLESVTVQLTYVNPQQEDGFATFTFPREALAQVPFKRLTNTAALIEEFGTVVKFENNILAPTNELLSMDDPAFVGSDMHHAVERYDTEIPEPYASDLRAKRTSDLAIVEGVDRLMVALDVTTEDFSGTTQDKVAKLMELKAQHADAPDVQEAADRAISQLINGDLEDESALSIAQIILAGSDLSQTLMGAAVKAGQKDFQGAYAMLKKTLDEFEADEPYRDTDDTAWRYFSSYVERIVYNEANKWDSRTVKLVPDAYFESYILAATCLLELRQFEGAEACAQRALALDPLSLRAYVRLYKAYELQDKDVACFDLTCDFLRTAFNPADIGVAYYRLAFYYWQRGKRRLAAACYVQSLEYASPTYESAIKELTDLKLSDISLETMSLEEAQKLIEHEGLPLAPTDKTLAVLQESAKAAVSMGFYAPAKQLVGTLGNITKDDLLFLVLQSLGEL